MPAGQGTSNRVKIDNLDEIQDLLESDTYHGRTKIGDGVRTLKLPEAIVSGQISVADTATPIVAARVGRQAVSVVNHGTTAIYLGTSSVTTTTGWLLPGVVGANATIGGPAAVYGIVAAGTQTVSYLEVY